MRHRNENAPLIGGSNGANQNNTCLGGQRNIATLGTTDHEARIASLGEDLIKAYARGDKSAAHQYKRAMYQAIAQRQPISQVERFAEIDKAIAGNAGCYFVECGDRDRARLAGAQ